MLRALFFSFCVILYGVVCAAQQVAPIPDATTLLQQVAEHQRKVDQTREDYTWHETVVTRLLDKNGNVKKTESEEDEIFFVNTHEIDRTVKKDGKELTPDEQKKEQDRVMKAVEKAQKTPPGQFLDKNTVSITQILGMMKTSHPRRETIDGRNTIAFDFTGDPHAKTHGVAEDASKKMSGTLWVDEQDREVRRLVARFDDNFHLGFGLFSVGKGSNFTFNQKLVNNELWLPVDAQAHVVAHALGMIGYRADVSVTDTNYQRFHAQAEQAPDASVVTHK
jgi:type V secretory pathway adhesin AidA